MTTIPRVAGYTAAGRTGLGAVRLAALHAAAVSCSFKSAGSAAVPGLRSSSLPEPAVLAARREQRELLQEKLASAGGWLSNVWLFKKRRKH